MADSPGLFTLSTASSLLTGLQVYYALSDTSDATGGGLTLTNNGTVTFSAGKVGNAANFVSASNQYLMRANNAKFETGTSDFTLAAWINFSSSTLQTMVSYGAFNFTGYGFITNANGVQAGIGVSGVNSFNTRTFGVDQSGGWKLLVTTYARAGNMILYIGNSVFDTIDISSMSASAISGADGFTIGAVSHGTVSGYFDGSVDEVGLWTRVLTAGELTTLWNSGNGTTYPF